MAKYGKRRLKRRDRIKVKREKTVSTNSNRSYLPPMQVNPRLRIPIGRSIKRTLRYHEQGIDLNPGVSGAVSTYVFSANGLYDPNITGVGHQPLGFDQLMAFYNHFTVIAARITVKFVNADDTYPQLAGIHVSGTSSTEADPAVIIENGMTNFQLLTPGSDGGKNSTELTQQVSVSSFMGRKNIMSEDDLRGSAAANPAEQVYFHVWAAPYNQTDTGVVAAVATIDYITVFTEPKELALS